MYAQAMRKGSAVSAFVSQLGKTDPDQFWSINARPQRDQGFHKRFTTHSKETANDQNRRHSNFTAKSATEA